MDGPATPGEHPELIALDEEQRAAVREQLTLRRSACGCCGGTDFDIGAALYLGFLFRSERTDSYMVALTCTNPRCSAQRTGVRLRGPAFLTPSGRRPRG